MNPQNSIPYSYTNYFAIPEFKSSELLFACPKFSRTPKCHSSDFLPPCSMLLWRNSTQTFRVHPKSSEHYALQSQFEAYSHTWSLFPHLQPVLVKELHLRIEILARARCNRYIEKLSCGTFLPFSLHSIWLLPASKQKRQVQEIPLQLHVCVGFQYYQHPRRQKDWNQ